ncbi:MAG: glycoside hydrolase, partial [Gammaproteobacteria bacterium]|nr:glycoside hydrolase [Gammaproteobacteria bacterium]
MLVIKARRYARLSGLLVAFLASAVFAQDTALISGQNINMVSGTEWPSGDPFLQRQNEPTIGISTRNELHLMGGSNDYRTVDLPGLPEGKTTGDSWLSAYYSYTGGGRWTSTLLPGYPQDPSCLEPDGSPNRNILCGYEASADPVIRPGTHGLFYYSGIVFTRSENPPSAGFVNTYIDLNNDERGDTIKYVRTALFDENAGGAGSSFIDKPWIAVDKPRGAATTIIEVPTETGTVLQEVQCGNLYAAWARIQGEDSVAMSSQIMFAKSEDCGGTFSAPKSLTLPNTINQGAAIAVSPLDGKIRVAWRQFANSTMSCVRKGSYWRNNPEAWPVDEIELAGYRLLASYRGNIIVDGDDTDDDYDDDDWDDDDEDDVDWEYDETETQRPPKLLRQLLAAWLNVLAGADATEIRDTMEAAEAWLELYASGGADKAAKKEAKSLHKKLRTYNKGGLDQPRCDSVMSMSPTGQNPDAIMVTTSSDFGATFSPPVAVASSTENNYFPFEQGTTEYSFRSTGYPAMTIDGEGRSYIAFTTRGLAIPDFDPVGGDGRVVVTTSMDGATWTWPIPIDEPEQRGHQLMPAMDFARGKVFVLYYDFREDVSRVFDRFITDLPVDATTPRHSVDVRAA